MWLSSPDWSSDSVFVCLTPDGDGNLHPLSLHRRPGISAVRLQHRRHQRAAEGKDTQTCKQSSAFPPFHEVFDATASAPPVKRCWCLGYKRDRGKTIPGTGFCHGTKWVFLSGLWGRALFNDEFAVTSGEVSHAIRPPPHANTRWSIYTERRVILGGLTHVL